MNRTIFRRAMASVIAVGVSLVSTGAFASAFQLWEQDAASMGNNHAGYAAEADNASTAFYNPAGLTRLHNQQLVLTGVNVFSDFKFKGNITVNTIGGGLTPLPVNAQGGGYGFIPAIHYAAPLDENVTFGFSIDVPFGLKTDYGYNTNLQYVSTKTSINVIDISPVIGIKVTDKLSFGIGPDMQKAEGEFDQVGTLSGVKNADGINKADDTAYGYHGGVLYEFTPATRVGLSYHSHVIHHLTGTSQFSGELANLFNVHGSNRALLNIAMPAYTALSVFHQANSRVSLMGSVIYTQWNAIQDLVLQNIAGVQNFQASTGIIVDIPQKFRNTFNFVTGLNFKATKKVTLKTGVGYDETPVRNAYRNVQLPDNNRYTVSAGAHYQISKAVGLDFAWTHIFINKAKVNPPAQHTGDEITTTDGVVTGGADVVGLQVVWDIA